MAEKIECPKCGCTSGNAWVQCNGRCPMPGSPHYSPEVEHAYDKSDPFSVPNLKPHMQPGMMATVKELRDYLAKLPDDLAVDLDMAPVIYNIGSNPFLSFTDSYDEDADEDEDIPC